MKYPVGYYRGFIRKTLPTNPYFTEFGKFASDARHCTMPSSKTSKIQKSAHFACVRKFCLVNYKNFCYTPLLFLFSKNTTKIFVILPLAYTGRLFGNVSFRAKISFPLKILAFLLIFWAFKPAPTLAIHGWFKIFQKHFNSKSEECSFAK